MRLVFRGNCSCYNRVKKDNLKEVVLVIQSVETDDTLERWSFTIDKGDENEKANKGSDVEVDLKQVQQGIKDVVRQIVATSMYNVFYRASDSQMI